MTNTLERRRLARLLSALLSCAAPCALGQAQPDVDLADPSDGWRFRPSLSVLGVYERDQGLSALETSVAPDRQTSASVGDFQPALALGLEAARSGSRGGFQGELGLLGRDPFDGDARALLFDGRAHAFRALGSRFRLELDESLRVERREAQPRGDFQRQQAQATLEYRGARGPAFRLQIADRRLGLPNARALDVTQRTLALGVLATPRAGTSVEAKALFRRFGALAARRNHLGAAFEAARVQPGGLLALHYHFTVALGASPLPGEAALPPTIEALTARVSAAVDFSSQATAEPPLASVASESLDELPDVPLADALDDEGDSWPSRQEHLLSLYGSRRLGARLSLMLRGQLRWRSGREPLPQELLGFDDRRWHLRATLRFALGRHSALIAQAARASESGNPSVRTLVRSQVFFGLQLR